MLFKLPGLRYFITAALGNWCKEYYRTIYLKIAAFELVVVERAGLYSEEKFLKLLSAF